MRRTRQSSYILLAGLWISLMGHAALGLGLAHWSDLEGPRPAHGPDSGETARDLQLPAPDERKPSEPKELRLGVDQGAAGTLTWLGFKEASEHQAREGKIEQSPMSLNPTPAAAPGDRPPLVAPPSPPAQIASTPAVSASHEVPFIEEAPMPELEGVPEQVDLEAAKALALRLTEASRAARATGERMTELLQELLDVPPVGAPRPRAAPTPSPQPPASSSGQETPAGGMPGLQADRESVAVAVRKAAAIRPGKVLAAEGLEILTRSPRFTTTSMLANRPRNPTVSVTFGRDGLVRRAVFVSDGRTTYSTGSDEVDQALLNSIYLWSARGKALQELPSDDPQAGITIMFTILLGG